MSRGYSTPTLLCLCALAFIVGRFVQQLPGLPDASGKGSKVSEEITAGPFRRSVIAVEDSVQQVLQLQQPQQARVSGNGSDATYSRPPVQPAESGNDFITSQPFQLLSWYPRMYLFPRFLDPERAEHVVQMARSRLAPSALALRKGDKESEKSNVRTSQGTFIARREDKEGVLAWMEDKLASLTGIPATHGEPFNVLRYQLGQHYDSHYDVFEPESYGPQASQRMATVLFYLTDVEEGGQTVFPLEGQTGLDRLSKIDYRSCKDGFKYNPRQGDALLFWSMHPNGTFDKHALHGGCPVVKGEKWVATKWIRDKAFG